jgi:hypothetical protein
MVTAVRCLLAVLVNRITCESELSHGHLGLFSALHNMARSYSARDVTRTRPLREMYSGLVMAVGKPTKCVGTVPEGSGLQV